MILAWFFSLFCVALLVGQSPIDISATLVFFGVLTYWIRNRDQFRFPKLGTEKIFIAWALVVLAGLLYSRQPETPWIKNFLEFRWMLEVYTMTAALMIINPDEKHIKRLIYILGGISAYCILAYILKYDPVLENQQILQTNLDYEKQGIRYRAGGLFLNPMPFAHTFGPLAVMLMGPVFFMNWKKTAENKFWILSAILTWLAAIFSYTRGVWAGMIVGLVVMGFLVDWKKGVKVTLALAFIFLAMFFAIPAFKERILFSMHITQTNDSERLVIWKANFEMFKDSPILGLGYSENSRKLREYFDRLNVPQGFLESHAHNQYIHFLAGTGILGLLCYLITIGIFLRMHLKAFRNYLNQQQNFWAGLALGVLGAEICFYIGGITESNFSIAKNRYLLILVWCFGAWLYLKSKESGKVQ
jgi:hypothetical protein